MQRVISLKPLSPQSQRRIRAERFACLSNPTLLFSVSTSPKVAFSKAEDMLITISENLRLWLETKNLQGYIRIVEASPNPNPAEIAQQIDIDKITNKQV